jgi:RecB family exonuclease
MSLPNGFQFSQSSLQDFEVCPRRFKLRYLDRLRWPAIESEPIEEAERLSKLGQDFHRLVYQHLLGPLDADILTASLERAEADLRHWWQNYLQYRPTALKNARTYPELTLSTPLRGYRLIARFDVLAVQPDGTFLILDWKTTRRQPARADLERRIQTRVYPYVLAAAGTALNNGHPINPAAIQMIYWYPHFPDQPELFSYSPELFRRDEQGLSELIERIIHASQRNHFPLVEDSKPCAYCVYRSHCDRGIKAGPLVALPEETPIEIDLSSLAWDQIAEIQF